MNYTILAVKYEKNDQWSIEFGDYVAQVVHQEKKDQAHHYYKAKVVTINSDKPKAMYDTIAEMNRYEL